MDLFQNDKKKRPLTFQITNSMQCFGFPRMVNQESSELAKVAVTSRGFCCRLCATLVLYSFDTVVLI